MYVEEQMGNTARNCPGEEQDGQEMAAEYPDKRYTFSVSKRLKP